MQKAMIKITGWIFLLVMIFGTLSGYAGASKHDKDFALHSAWGTQISELNQILKECRSQKNRLEKESDKLAKKIIKEKRKSRGESNRKLDTLLRKSQHLVFTLESLSKQIVQPVRLCNKVAGLAIKSTASTNRLFCRLLNSGIMRHRRWNCSND